MNFENLSWPKPIDDGNPENAAELLERQQADEIFERQREEEIERTADLVAEREKKVKAIPKKIYHSHSENKYRSGKKKLNDNPIRTSSDKNEAPVSRPDVEDQEGDEVRHPYDEIYPYNRNLRR